MPTNKRPVKPVAAKQKAKKTSAKKASAKKASATKTSATKTSAKSAPARAAATKTPAKKMAPRADFGAPIDGFFKKQPAHLRAILDALRAIVEDVAPDARSSIKWGMPVYTIGGASMCALGAHKAHVNLILSGPPGTFADPDGRLSGEGKIGKHLKVTSIDELPRAAVRGWVRAAAERARQR